MVLRPMLAKNDGFCVSASIAGKSTFFAKIGPQTNIEAITRSESEQITISVKLRPSIGKKLQR